MMDICRSSLVYIENDVWIWVKSCARFRCVTKGYRLRQIILIIDYMESHISGSSGSVALKKNLVDTLLWDASKRWNARQYLAKLGKIFALLLLRLLDTRKVKM